MEVNALPRHRDSGTISSGSITAVTSSVSNDSHFDFVARAFLRDVSNSLVYTKGIHGMATKVGAADPVIDFQTATDDEFSSVSCEFSCSISGGDLVAVLTVNTGSSYPFTLAIDGTTWGF